MSLCLKITNLVFFRFLLADVVALVLLISHADQINDILFGHESALKGLHDDPFRLFVLTVGQIG